MEDDRKIEIKRQCLANGIVMEGNWLVTGHFGFEEPVRIGNYCELVLSTAGAFTYMRSQGFLRCADVGRYCSLAYGVVIGTAQHPIDGLSSAPLFYNDSHFGFYDDYRPNQSWQDDVRTVIGNDVWIGRDALIMPGVRVHDGSVIGARAVITKDVEPYSIVAGVPARIVNKRFNNATIERLLGLSWWNYDMRSWCRQNQDFHSIPLTDEKLARLEHAVAMNDLKALMPNRHLLIPQADGIAFSDF